VVLIELQSERLIEVFSCVGERGVPAEDVARSCLQEAQTYLAAEVPVGEHLADQLLLPMALGEGGQFLTTQPSLHTLTQIDMLQRFLPVHIAVTQKSAATFLIAVSPVA
jgi:RNA 3'-terminal phosphate cyclase (ATP)